MYLSFYCKGSKRVTQGFTVRGSWRPNRTAIHWPHSYGHQCCVFLVLLMLNRRPSFLLSTGFLYHILSPTGLRNYWGPWGPLWLGVAFHTTSYQQLLWTPTVWLPVLTELYNSSMPTQSLEWHVWSSSSGNNCHAVQRSLSSGASVYECTMGILPCPISSAKSAQAISFDYWPMECVTSFRRITLEWHVWPGWRSKYNRLSSLEMDSVTRIQILDEAVCISLHALGKVWIYLFSLQLWVSSMADWVSLALDRQLVWEKKNWIQTNCTLLKKIDLVSHSTCRR